MLAFAVVFRTLIDRSVLGAFVGASFAWIVVSVAAWFVRRNFRFLRRSQNNQGDAVPRRHIS